MNAEQLGLLQNIEEAFKDHPFPSGRIIAQGVDLSYHIEAQRVDAYIRARRESIDRHNSALVAFHYLTAEAGLSVLPLYMGSIIRSFRDDDFIIDVILGALSSVPRDTPYAALGCSGVEMRKLASDKEASVVCRFCQWLLKKASSEGLEERGVSALNLWCSKTSPI